MIPHREIRAARPLLPSSNSSPEELAAPGLPQSARLSQASLHRNGAAAPSPRKEQARENREFPGLSSAQGAAAVPPTPAHLGWRFAPLLTRSHPPASFRSPFAFETKVIPDRRVSNFDSQSAQPARYTDRLSPRPFKRSHCWQRHPVVFDAAAIPDGDLAKGGVEHRPEFSRRQRSAGGGHGLLCYAPRQQRPVIRQQHPGHHASLSQRGPLTIPARRGPRCAPTQGCGSTPPVKRIRLHRAGLCRVLGLSLSAGRYPMGGKEKKYKAHILQVSCLVGSPIRTSAAGKSLAYLLVGECGLVDGSDP